MGWEWEDGCSFCGFGFVGGGCFRLHLGQRDRKKLIASDEAAISETCSCGKSS